MATKNVTYNGKDVYHTSGLTFQPGEVKAVEAEIADALTQKKDFKAGGEVKAKPVEPVERPTPMVKQSVDATRRAVENAKAIHEPPKDKAMSPAAAPHAAAPAPRPAAPAPAPAPAPARPSGFGHTAGGKKP